MKDRADRSTLDLLNWRAPDVSVRFEDERQVRAASLAGRVSRAVAATLKESGRSREEIAAEMSDYLGADVSEGMLAAYASGQREDHNISLVRALALLNATGDARLFGELLDPHGFAVIPKKYLAAIEEAMCDDVIERAQGRKKLARRTWRGN